MLMPAPPVVSPTVVFTVVFESVVMVVFVLVVSAVSLLFELSLQATKLAAMANTAKNFFMLRVVCYLMGAKVGAVNKSPNYCNVI
jgi:hypothetical protein